MAGDAYSAYYSGNDAFGRIAIVTAGGTHYAKVLSSTVTETGDQLSFAPAYPTGAEWQDIHEVNFLLKCRLASDDVTLTHHALETYIDLAFRTVSA